MNKIENVVVENLAWLVSYNGYYDDLQAMKRHLVECEKPYNSAPYPHFLNSDPDDFIGLTWAMLVLLYGEYGTSPRFGWVKDINAACSAIDILCTHCDTEY